MAHDSAKSQKNLNKNVTNLKILKYINKYFWKINYFIDTNKDWSNMKSSIVLFKFQNEQTLQNIKGLLVQNALFQLIIYS